MSTVHESFSGFETLYENEAERVRHLNAIQSVVGHIGASVDEVDRIYGIVLRRYKQGAKIKDFLPILVSRRVVYLLGVRSKNNSYRKRPDTPER